MNTTEPTTATIASDAVKLPGEDTAVAALQAMPESVDLPDDVARAIVRTVLDAAGPDVVAITQNEVAKLIRPLSLDDTDAPDDLAEFSDASLKVFSDFVRGIRRLVLKKDNAKAGRALDAALHTFDAELITRGTMLAVDQAAAAGDITPDLAGAMRRHLTVEA